jgi:hypothetical protein
MRKILLVLMSLLLVYALVGCNEPQEPRVRPNPPVGQGLLYPPAPPAPISVIFGTAEGECPVELQLGGSPAATGNLAIAADQKSYTVSAITGNNYGGAMACFKVDLGTALYNYTTITFTYKQTGDAGYKNISILASASKPGNYTGLANTDLKTAQIVDVSVEDTYTVDIIPSAGYAGESVLYFIIATHCGSELTSYTVSNVKIE